MERGGVFRSESRLFMEGFLDLQKTPMYKMPFAVSKILGEIRFFYGDFGTDKEFVEDKILELGVTVLGCQVRF